MDIIKNNNNDDNRLFQLDKESYLNHYLPVYNEVGMQPKHLIQFLIILPFHIPLEEHSRVTKFLKSGDACTFFFTDYISHKYHMDGIISGNKPVIKVFKSKVELTYVSCQDLEIPLPDRMLHYAFNTLIDTLNYVISSYILLKRDLSVYRITTEMLDFCLICRDVNLKEGIEDLDPENSKSALYHLHMKLPVKRERMSAEEVKKVLWYADIFKEQINPFLLSQEIMHYAFKQFEDGLYREAVINAQISVESFLSTLLRELMKFEGESEVDISAKVENILLSNMVKCEFHPRLGGVWNINQQNSEIGNWYKHTYQLRNKVAHQGYLPHYEEVENALEHAANFSKYVTDRVMQKKKKYKNIARYFIIENI